MTKKWRLRTRFMAAYTGLIVLGFSGLALLAGQQISQGAVEDFERDLSTQAALVARGLRETIERFDEGEASQRVVEQALQEFASQLGGHLVLIDTTGRAWLDSDGTLPTENQMVYPEVEAAQNGRVIYDVRDNEQGVSIVYAAAAIVEDGQTISIIRLSRPLSAASEVVVRRWLALAGGVILLTLLALAASLWLSASLARPLTQLRTTALSMAAGDLSQRLAEDRSDEIGQLARAFNHMARQVQSMLEEQRAFASNASHELRTPLTTIRLRSEALREDRLDEATARQYIVEIDDEVSRMGNLVEDLILLSRLEAGRAERGHEQINVNLLAQKLVAEWQSQIAAQNITLTLKTMPDLPAITASVTHLMIVFRNLLSNAIKYTPEGGHIVWQLSAANGHLQATITDNGVGIAANDIPHLFERFYRADKARTRQVSGAGLGLSLVQTVVQLYDGRIDIHSTGLGHGTTVAVSWPLNPNSPAPITPSNN